MEGRAETLRPLRGTCKHRPMRVPTGKTVISSWPAVPSCRALKTATPQKEKKRETATLRQRDPRTAPRSQETELQKMNFKNTSEMDFSDCDYLNVDGLVEGPHPLSCLKAHQVAAVVIYVVIFMVGVPGNLLVLWVTASEARRSINAIWFLNLALADLLSCLVLPIRITNILMHGNWPSNEKACRILTSLFVFNLYASVLLLATISADRFLIVFKPIWCQNYRVAWRAWLASGVAWILALVLTIPSFVLGVFFNKFLSKKVFCGVALALVGEDVELALTITLFVLSFLGPLVTMSICYSFLLLWTWRRPATRSTKTLKVVVAVVTSFFVFWLPYQVSGMVLVLFSSNSSTFKLFLSLDVLWVALAYVNCCINPIIYVAAARGLHIRVFMFQPGQLHELLTEE